jgi:hypothetical protein
VRISLSVTDEIVERAREVAHQQGTSLNALIRSYLESFAGGADGQELADRFDALWNERVGHSEGWRFDREEPYEERLNRGPR